MYLIYFVGSIGMQIVEGVAYLNYNNTIQPVDLTASIINFPKLSILETSIIRVFLFEQKNVVFS